jgi:hypothetical protein
MNKFEIILEAKEEEINLKKLPKKELQNLIEIALEYENYEMCAYLKKIIDGNI